MARTPFASKFNKEKNKTASNIRGTAYMCMCICYRIKGQQLLPCSVIEPAHEIMVLIT